eukprot:TRINITY_DN12153_c0_g1_i1.p1 TRINITY_DN12153_c0_g1~~TRINITY_DN12153_c0_g1_i1.p1  ORF type:complete len:401 (+),score=95.53 TRINITY_DN12153_c0_g1_i1:76-1278(+)
MAGGRRDVLPDTAAEAASQQRCRELLGAACVAGSAWIFGVTAVLVRVITEPMPQLMELRYFVGAVTAAACLLGARRCGVRAACGRELLLFGPADLRWLLLSRTALHWLLLWAWWVAVRNMPLGDATAIGLAGPVLTALLARFVLGETLPPYFVPAAACAAAGVILVVFPLESTREPTAPEGGHRLVGLGAVLIALCSGALLPLCIRVSCEAHWLEVEHVTAFGCAAVITPIYCAICSLWIPSALQGWGADTTNLFLGTVLGLLAFLGLGLQTRGFQLGPAPRIAMTWYTQIPFCYMLQWVVFGERPPLSACAGAGLVVAASLLALAGTDPEQEPVVELPSQGTFPEVAGLLPDPGTASCCSGSQAESRRHSPRARGSLNSITSPPSHAAASYLSCATPRA